MTKDELKQRTRRFALDVIRLVESLPRSRSIEVVGRQLMRSATSVGANYRAACRAKSAADFVAKMGIVEEEADESMYWMELLVGSGSIPADEVDALLRVRVSLNLNAGFGKLNARYGEGKRRLQRGGAGQLV